MMLPTGPLRALLLALMAAVPSAQEHGSSAKRESTSLPARTRPLVSIGRAETREGTRWSVLCEDTQLDELLRALARKAGLALEGAELLPLGAVSSIQLERRPLEQVLEFVLGSQGLQFEIAHGAIVVRPPTNDSADLLRQAQDAWRTVEVEGEPRAAAMAKLAQGNLAEVSGQLEEAYHIYAQLAEDESGDESAEALYRAGRILEQLGHWAEAAQHFRSLASLEGAGDLRSKARLELARASIELGDPKSALHLLNFLDANFETHDQVELAERRLVRASALNATHEYVEALRVLGTSEVVSAFHSQARTLAILAEAFQGLGFEVEAARAWLIYAREAISADERSSAFEKAAQLSLEGGDELGALFVCREAAKAGADEGLGHLAHEARVRLGLEDEEVPGSVEERLAQAEEFLARNELARAAGLLEGLYLARAALSEPDQAQVLAGWARVLAARSGANAALDMLSKARDTLEDPEAARTLDVAAATLLEAEGRLDEAAEAYRGNY